MAGTSNDLSTCQLPLDSPKWQPLELAHRELIYYVGNKYLADRDLTELLHAGKVRSMRRRLILRNPEIGPPAPDRELVMEEFWHKWVLESWSDGLLIMARHQRPPKGGPVLARRIVGFVFYVWWPDFEKAVSVPGRLVEMEETIADSTVPPTQSPLEAEKTADQWPWQTNTELAALQTRAIKDTRRGLEKHFQPKYFENAASRQACRAAWTKGRRHQCIHGATCTWTRKTAPVKFFPGAHQSGEQLTKLTKLTKLTRNTSPIAWCAKRVSLS
jgi:hypothetical protein